MSGNNLQDPFSFYREGLGDQIQETGFGGKSVYSVSHLACPGLCACDVYFVHMYGVCMCKYLPAASKISGGLLSCSSAYFLETRPITRLREAAWPVNSQDLPVSAPTC